MLPKEILKKLIGETGLGFLDYFRHPELRDPWGGPFNNQAFRQEIFLELLSLFDFSAIIETGSYRGSTTEYLHRQSGLPTYSVEVVPRNYGSCRARFLWNRQVHLYRNDSRAFLRELLDGGTFGDRTVFVYLDAHWHDYLPLPEELEIIFRSGLRAVVMVDDFRVDDDAGYGYDGIKGGQQLTLDYLKPLSDFGFRAFYPNRRSEEETGAKRGCVVLSNRGDLVEVLRRAKTLREYPPAGSS